MVCLRARSLNLLNVLSAWLLVRKRPTIACFKWICFVAVETDRYQITHKIYIYGPPERKVITIILLERGAFRRSQSTKTTSSIKRKIPCNKKTSSFDETISFVFRISETYDLESWFSDVSFHNHCTSATQRGEWSERA